MKNIVISDVKSSKELRNSTLELLRILCMLFVIAHHCVVHGGAMGMEPCANKYIASLILPLGKISFTCFVAISMWFLVDQKFKASRFIRAWLEVLFYSFLMMFPSLAWGVEVGVRDWLGSILPIGGNSHGFAATYLAFYLLLPLLNKLTESLTKRQTIWCLFILGYVQIIEPILAQLGLANLALHPFVSEITLFGFCFFVALYLKRWTPGLAENAAVMGCLSIATWAFVATVTIQSWRVGGAWSAISPMFASGENSILYLLGGYSLFLCFNSLPVFHSKAVNVVASTTFGVLLIHDHGFFRYPLWNVIADVPSWWYGPLFPLRILVWTFVVFAICSAIDLVRQNVIERPLLQTNIANGAARSLDKVWAKETRNNSASTYRGSVRHATDFCDCVEVSHASGKRTLIFSRRSKAIGAIILIALICLFYSGYMFSVIPPQTGWIQDISARLVSGERIYRDFYWYTPPLFPWFSAELFKIFGTNLFCYLCVGFLINRIVPALVMYGILIKLMRPSIAVVLIMFGTTLAATYSAEQLFDLNPFLLTGVLIQGALLCLLLRQESNIKAMIGIIGLGMISGAQVMAKQTGLTVLVACLVCLICLSWLREFKALKCHRIWVPAILYLFGAAAVIASVLIALTLTNSLDSFFACMVQASSAKGVSGVAIDNIVNGMVSIPELLIATGLILPTVWYSRRSCVGRHTSCGRLWVGISAIVLFVGSICIGWRALPSIYGVYSYLNTKGSVWLALGAICCALMVYGTYRALTNKRKIINSCALLIPLAAIYAVLPQISTEKIWTILQIGALSSFKQYLLLTIFYLFVALWIKDLIGIFFRKERPSQIFIMSSMYLGFFSGTLLSATIQELYIMPMAVLLGARILEACRILSFNDAFSRAFPKIGTVAYFVTVAIIVLCTAAKLSMPYGWHAWHMDPANNSLPVNDVAKLRGFRLSEVQEEQYRMMLDAIDRYVKEGEEIVQFPSVPLFNVLTEHPSQRYLAVPYFDVASDELAEAMAEDLYENNPDYFLMGDIGEGDWQTLEAVYRGGEESGQREIKRFYDEVVQKNYQRIACIDNGGNGYSISLWKNAVKTSPLNDGTVSEISDEPLIDVFNMGDAAAPLNEMGVQVSIRLPEDSECTLNARILDGDDVVWSGKTQLTQHDDTSYVKFEMGSTLLPQNKDLTLEFSVDESYGDCSIGIYRWGSEFPESGGLCWFMS